MNGLNKSHQQHAGELYVQRMRKVPSRVSASLADAIHDQMPSPLVEFYRGLRCLPLGTLDARGRPWATLLCNPETTAPTSERLRLRARVNVDDPFIEAVLSPTNTARLFAGVAIDFAQRTRVKLGGVVDAATLDPADTLTLELRANEHMGNCPKYITVRQLRPLRRTPRTTALANTLSPAAVELLQRASTLFVATRHVDRDPRETDMGFNHRGGPPGFLRSFEDERGAHLVLPDYSGNRFYQSLGNVESDPVMGLAVPDFETGALLQVTGRARNLFDDEAARLMPGATLVTVLSVDEAYLTDGALDLELVGAEQLSPYNPRSRPLAHELPSDRKELDLKATLIDITAESKRISTFTFALSEPAEVVPGGHAIFDFSDQVKTGYQHMNSLYPQSLNDDHVRAFTVSKLSPDRRQLSITVKKAGLVSGYLHALSSRRDPPVEVSLKGFGGTFTCFEQGHAMPHMLWVAGGVGITPFLAMHRALRDSGRPLPEIELFYACRQDEIELIRELTDLEVRVFDSKALVQPAAVERRQFHRRRLTQADFQDLPLLERATVFVCGPPGFTADVTAWLEPRVDPSRLRFERFGY
jgi:ferredoxin-NADP reductase/predicted pyridoxine 5'-phosphate oxidase superfamily flavin-nucleotide-binding protein